LLLQVVNGPKSQLGTIQDAVITQGDAVKSQINGTIAGARGSVNNLKGQVVGQLSNVEETYKPVVEQVDGYRCGSDKEESSPLATEGRLRCVAIK
jgi:hypothetical protein